ncbi:vasoactive intestinal polypeptide receptor 2-like [Notothenia coriiceps]|uniref:Vasoactive intestinal polypeptide receptor 2-like n=1 Tax=Notothenia coriiceps TaxID=8208 RepID=A0A6I9N8M9_9TELE|nr:PREDICTED: vasoactive intestinal polypeptide receptor 2-like [Notothenia coriiceps]
MSRLIGGILLTLWLPQTVFSSLHPECEFIFELEREERLCLQFIAEQSNTSSEGCQPFWDAVACWPHAAVGETVERGCPAVFSLFRNNTGYATATVINGM